jgi:hypothetical protein
MLNIPEIYKAYQAGNIIKDPAKWKAGTELTNYLTAILAGVIALAKWQLPDLVITEEVKDLVLQILGGILVLINVISGRITTEKKITLKGQQELQP